MLSNAATKILPFSFTSPLFKENPEAYLARIRELKPIHWSNQVNSWIVIRYEDCEAILKHPNFGRRDTWRIITTGDEALLPMEEFRSDIMLLRDPPEHHRLRQLVHKAFTPKIVETLRPAVYDIMDKLLKDYVDSDEINLVEAVAYPLPFMVISVMLGVPAEDWCIIHQYSKDLRGIFEPQRSQAQIDAGNRLVVEMKAYFRALIDKKKENPDEYLLTNLIAAYEEGDKQFTMDELISNTILLLFAGYETTSNLISNGVFELLSHPDQFMLLKAHPDLIPSAVTEMLRYRPPAPMTIRTVLQDTEYDGLDFKHGQRVMIALNAANRDPEIYLNPDQFDIRREGAAPLAFGQGFHYCLGAPLAKLETEIALEELIAKMPDMRLKDPEPHWFPSNIFRGHADLYLQY